MSAPLRLLPLLLILGAALAAPAPSAQTSPGDVVPGELIVKLRPGVDVTDLGKLPVVGLFDLAPVRPLSSRLNIWLVRYDVGALVPTAVLDALRATPLVELAQFNHRVELRSTAPNDLRSTVPNDDRFDDQWAMRNTGQTGGNVDADIDADLAWSTETDGVTATGDHAVVAVIDGGFDLTHPDMAYWTNPGETPGNGVDDDGNGYVDDVNGWDAYGNDGSLPNSSHGTHVAGTVGARGNNGSGVVGVVWGGAVLPVAGSSTSEATVVAAYSYVLDQRVLYDQTDGGRGAFVVATNSSFGVNYGNPANYPVWCDMYEQMGQAGILSAVATANVGIDVDVQGDVPSACASDYVVAVTNTTDLDTKNPRAAYGDTHIDLGAPGTDILSTDPGGGVRLETGTSMASPHVAGAVALLYSAASAARVSAYKANPAAVALVFKGYVLDGSDPVSDLQGTTVSGGRLNLDGAISQMYGDGGEPQPATLSVSINGPSHVDAGDYGTWSAAVAGGSGATAFDWDYKLIIPRCEPDNGLREVTCDKWYDGSETATFTRTVSGSADLVLRLVVTRGGESATAYKTVRFGNGASSSAAGGGGRASLGTHGPPTELTLAPSAPNPTSGPAEVVFGLPEPGPVTLAVYDVAGREVARLADGAHGAGYHRVRLNAGGLAPGTYVYRLTTPTGSAARTMAVVR